MKLFSVSTRSKGEKEETNTVPLTYVVSKICLFFSCEECAIYVFDVSLIRVGNVRQESSLLEVFDLRLKVIYHWEIVSIIQGVRFA